MTPGMLDPIATGVEDSWTARDLAPPLASGLTRAGQDKRWRALPECAGRLNVLSDLDALRIVAPAADEWERADKIEPVMEAMGRLTGIGAKVLLLREQGRV